MPADARLLEVDNLRKVFRARGRSEGVNEFVAVDGVSFSLPPRRSLAIVGESGSGKTTIARIIVGLDRPTSGELFVDGELRSYPPRLSSRERKRRAREVQIVFQDPYSSLDPRQRVGDAVGEVLALHFGLGGDERRSACLEQFRRVGLRERHLDALPRRLSGGERQRVAIARALAARPKLLILDEAVASLDVSVQAQILNLLLDIKEESDLSFLFISHDLGAVRQVCDDAIVMQDGRVVERGDVDQVIDAPEHPYTQRLRHSVPTAGWRPARRPRTAIG